VPWLRADLTGDKKYLDAAGTIANFYKSIDRIPLDHSHGMLCCQVSLLLLFEATKDASLEDFPVSGRSFSSSWRIQGGWGGNRWFADGFVGTVRQWTRG